MEQTQFSKPKSSGAGRFLLVFDVDGEAVDELTDDAAIEDALDVFKLVDDWLELLLPSCGFYGLREDMAIETLLLADETPEAASDWVGRWRILISPRYFFLRSFVCWAIFSSAVFS